MSTVKRTINADKEDFLKFLREQQSLWVNEGAATRIQREQFRNMGRTEGIEWAIRAIEDWQVIPDD